MTAAELEPPAALPVLPCRVLVRPYGYEEWREGNSWRLADFVEAELRELQRLSELVCYYRIGSVTDHAELELLRGYRREKRDLRACLLYLSNEVPGLADRVDTTVEQGRTDGKWRYVREFGREVYAADHRRAKAVPL